MECTLEAKSILFLLVALGEFCDFYLLQEFTEVTSCCLKTTNTNYIRFSKLQHNCYYNYCYNYF